MAHAVDISLAEARALIERAVDKAAHIGARGAFAVVGGSGTLVSGTRMDRGGAGGLARAHSKAWISATQQIPSTEHHSRMATLPPPIAAGFVACSPEARFPGAGGMPIHAEGDPARPVIGGFSASGATIGPFVRIPGIERRMLIAQGKPANSEDLIVLWALGMPYEGQHGDDEKRWQEAFGALPDEEGAGYENPPPAEQPERAWALALADSALAEAERCGVRVAVAVLDRYGEPIQQDAADHAPSAAVGVATATGAAAAGFGLPSGALREHYGDAAVAQLAATLPHPILAVPGAAPILKDGVIVGALGIGGADPATCAQIARAVISA